jgi:hypothetical protein
VTPIFYTYLDALQRRLGRRQSGVVVGSPHAVPVAD